jgi:hypothetical protein
MGMASVPSGKRLTLPRKISVNWALLKVVTALVDETTATTSAADAPAARLSAIPTTANQLWRYMQVTYDPVSPHEIDRDAEDIHRAARPKSGLDIDQRAR